MHTADSRDDTVMNHPQAAAANTYAHNVGNDLSLSDGFDPEYLDAEVELDEFGHTAEERRERQARNLRMSVWFNG